MKNYIGENIKRIRERRGMSVDKVARMLEVPAGTVEKWEAGKEIPGMDALNLLSRLFGVPADELSRASYGSEDGRNSDIAGKDAQRETAGVNGDGAWGRPVAKSGNGGGALDFEKSPLFRYKEVDEVVFWHGQPTGEHVGGRMSLNIQTFLISIIFTIFAVIWSVAAFNFSGMFGTFGLLFIGIGVYTAFGRSIILNTNKPNTYYAVTDRRVMLCITGRTVRYRDIKYRRLHDVHLIMSRKGTGCGTIVFTVPNLIPEYPYGKYSDRIANTNQLLDSFIDIADAERVYELINEAKSGYPCD